MTRGAVRCSAWLGVRLDSVETCNKSPATRRLAEADRITVDRKLAATERMKPTKDQSRRPVESGGMTGGEKVELTGVVMKPRGRGAELAADVERETSAGKGA